MSSAEPAVVPGCTHLGGIRPVTPPERLECEACVQIGSGWVHLRQCLTCGLVGCCDSSPNQHASRHARAEGHPIMRSLEPGEDWAWCVVDEVELEPA